jgi:hypothetical protein
MTKMTADALKHSEKGTSEIHRFVLMGVDTKGMTEGSFKTADDFRSLSMQYMLLGTGYLVMGVSSSDNDTEDTTVGLSTSDIRKSKHHNIERGKRTEQDTGKYKYEYLRKYMCDAIIVDYLCLNRDYFNTDGFGCEWYSTFVPLAFGFHKSSPEGTYKTQVVILPNDIWNQAAKMIYSTECVECVACLTEEQVKRRTRTQDDKIGMFLLKKEDCMRYHILYRATDLASKMSSYPKVSNVGTNEHAMREFLHYDVPFIVLYNKTLKNDQGETFSEHDAKRLLSDSYSHQDNKFPHDESGYAVKDLSDVLEDESEYAARDLSDVLDDITETVQSASNDNSGSEIASDEIYIVSS